MLIVSVLSTFVKYFTVPQILLKPLLVHCHQRNNGIFETLRISLCFQPQNQLIFFFVDCQPFQNICRVRPICIDDIVWICDYLCQLVKNNVRDIRVPLADMRKLLIRYDNLICLDIIRYDAVKFTIQPAYKVHVQVPAISNIR